MRMDAKGAENNRLSNKSFLHFQDVATLFVTSSYRPSSRSSCYLRLASDSATMVLTVLIRVMSTVSLASANILPYKDALVAH